MLAARSSPVSGFVFVVAVLASAPKISPESVAGQVFDAVEAGQVEVLADERSRDVKAKLSRDHEHLPAHPGILGCRGQWHQLTPARHGADRFPGSVGRRPARFTVGGGRANAAQRR
jgi:hypothetical protein